MVIELSQAAEAAGATAVMVAPPTGLRGDAAILAHYRAVAGAVSIPIVVQDEPVTTGVIMPPDPSGLPSMMPPLASISTRWPVVGGVNFSKVGVLMRRSWFGTLDGRQGQQTRLYEAGRRRPGGRSEQP